jgi:hypothetical protein
MITIAVTILTVFFAIGTISPLLVTHDTDEIVELEPKTTLEEQTWAEG